ncbi:MAG: radical SAM protein [Clostridium sp.]|nr:radical SAM protein [Clostridium sp.]MCM1547230.1 radical SAM protein [Ruminococcus sp.]
MKHSNISIFVPHAGCPHQCSFCNQKTISGAQHSPSAEEVHEICRKALEEVSDRNNAEIAFFGGSFTAIERTYMLSLLEAAHEYVGENGFKGIRISTRPDFIDRETLDILKTYGVTAIELGAQSMKNKVLTANERGHTVEDVYNASRLIREYGFELGLQIMVGLYRSTVDDERTTAKKIFEIHPDTLRIYPVVILKGTKLAQLYESGEYQPFDFDWVVDFCSKLLGFELAGIKIIKCGLHASEFVEHDMVAGFYHPAFRELCEGAIYRYNIAARIYDHDKNEPKKKYVLAVNPSCISKALGHKKSNVEYFREMGININIIGDERIPKYQCELRG